MFRTRISKLTGVSVVTLAAAALAAGAAMGGSQGAEPTSPDWIERTVAAYPYGEGFVAQAGSQRERDTWFRDALVSVPAPDAVDRAVAARARDTWFRDPVEVTRIPDAVDRAVAARARESLASSPETQPVGAALDPGSTVDRSVVALLAALVFALFAASLLVSLSLRRKGAQTA